MSLLSNLFGKANSEEASPQNKQPDNTRLLKLLHAYRNDESSEDYQHVVDELMNGNAYLLLPTVDGAGAKETWKTMEEGEGLKLTSIFDVDGLTVLGAFTSEETLLEWANKKTEYTAMPSSDALDLCLANGIERIVIDSRQPTMFVLQRGRDNLETETLRRGAKELIAFPAQPIEGRMLEKLKTRCHKKPFIQEVRQFILSRGKENSLVLGFKLDGYNENTRSACIQAVQDAVQGELFEQAVDVLFFENEDRYQSVKEIESSLVYKQ